MITVLNRPLEIVQAYSPDGANLSITVDSDLSNYFSFRYVQLPSVKGVLTSPLRITPNVVGSTKGTLQPHRVIQSFLSYNLHEELGFQDNPDHFVIYDIAVGEEHNGFLQPTGATYNITYGATVSGYAWNGTLQYGSTATYVKYTTGVTGNGLIDFLTTGPTVQNINIAESAFVSFINGIFPATGASGMGASAPSTNLALTVTVTSMGGTNSSYFIIPSYNSDNYSLMSCNVGPADLNALADAGFLFGSNHEPVEGPVITCDTRQYTVRITDYNR